MQTQISAFQKEEKAKYFVGEYLGELVGVSNNYTPTIVEDKLALSMETKTTAMDMNIIIADFLFMVVGFVIARRTFKFREKKKTGVNYV